MDLELLLMNEVYITTIGNIINFLLLAVSFVFKSIAIYVLSKRNGFKKLYLAFIPFLNFILVGKLIGKIMVFGRPIKNIGVWVCIVSALEFLLGFSTYVGVLEDVLSLVLNASVTINVPLIDKLEQNLSLSYALLIASLVVSIVKIFFNVSMMFALFRKYVPQKYFLYGILSVFFDFMFGFLLFSLRKKEPMTQEDYYREMARRRGYYVYRVNPNDFNNPYNSHNQYNKQSTKPSQTEEDPFPEFSDKNSGGNSQNGDSKADDLFD